MTNKRTWDGAWAQYVLLGIAENDSGCIKDESISSHFMPLFPTLELFNFCTIFIPKFYNKRERQGEWKRDWYR
jgi:hypothetical protein